MYNIDNLSHGFVSDICSWRIVVHTCFILYSPRDDFAWQVMPFRLFIT